MFFLVRPIAFMLTFFTYPCPLKIGAPTFITRQDNTDQKLNSQSSRVSKKNNFKKYIDHEDEIDSC